MSVLRFVLCFLYAFLYSNFLDSCVKSIYYYGMKTFELIAPCHFGLEAVLKKEILDLGYDISQVEDGRVTFIGDEEAICRANIFLRSAERVLLN